MDTIKNCFDIILQGEREESWQAARQVRKLLYSSSSGKKQFNEIEDVVNRVAQNYDKIAEDWRQENFVVAISVIYYLHDKEMEPDFLFPWLFKLLQHPNGNIRYAAVRMFHNELGPLTVYIRIPDYKPSILTTVEPKHADEILFSLFVSLNSLLGELNKPQYKRYKYIDSLPTSPYKSAQMVMAEMQELCGPEYMDSLAERYQNSAHEFSNFLKRLD